MSRRANEEYPGRLIREDGNWRPVFGGIGAPEEMVEPIRDHVAQAVYRATDDQGRLSWERLSPEEGLLVRGTSEIGDAIGIVASHDGVVLALDGDAGKPWAPLHPSDPMPTGTLSRLGWSDGTPRFAWRYCTAPATGAPAIEVIWWFGGLPATWVEEVLSDRAAFTLRIDGQECRLERDGDQDDELSFRGLLPLRDARRPAIRHIDFEPPLRLEIGGREQGTFRGSEAVTVEAEDFTAVVGGRETRLVATADLEDGFVARVLTAEDTLLPDAIPEGSVPGIPWELDVCERDPIDRALDGRRMKSQTWRCWELKPRAERETPATWRDIFPGAPPAQIRFHMGHAAESSGIQFIHDRLAAVTWRIRDAHGVSSPLCMCVPQWLPVGYECGDSLPIQAEGFEFKSSVTTEVRGIKERFLLGPSSELPRSRLLVDVESWSAQDEAGHELDEFEVLGAAAGYVRWSRAPGSHPRPADWANRSASVLVVREAGDRLDQWGGLYVPEGEISKGIPWNHLEEVAPYLESETPHYRLSLPAGQDVAWLGLWGFFSRIDRVPLRVQDLGKIREVISWITDAGLPLFPQNSDLLLRSFAPMYCVRGKSAEHVDKLAFESSEPRPTLRIGRKLTSADELKSWRLGEFTRLRGEIVERGKRPEEFTKIGRPGARFAVNGPIGDRVLWLLLENGSLSPEDSVHRLIVTWDAVRGWCFRGFYGSADEPALQVGHEHDGNGQTLPVRIDQSARLGTFSLSLRDGRLAWSDAAPAEVRSIPEESLARWADAWDFGKSGRPAELRDFDYDPPTGDVNTGWSISFTPRTPADPVGRRLAIRLWQPRPGTRPEDLVGARIEHLGRSHDGDVAHARAITHPGPGDPPPPGPRVEGRPPSRVPPLTRDEPTRVLGTRREEKDQEPTKTVEMPKRRF